MRKWFGPALSAPVTIWLVAAFALPMAAVILLSLHESSDPFADLIQTPSLQQFLDIASDSFYYRVIGETILVSAIVTLVSALLGYPVAFWLVRLPARYRAFAFAIILVPLLTNVVVRSLGIMLLLSPDGLVNDVLGLFGIPPFRTMLFNDGAVAVALTQVFMPFMVLALYDNLQNTSPHVHQAAESLGATPEIRFLTVDFPLSLPGLKAGMILVFLMASTSFVSAELVGGKKVWMAGMLVLQEALTNLNAPLASAIALIMTLIGLVFAAGFALFFDRLVPWKKGRVGNPLPIPNFIVAILRVIGSPVRWLLFSAALLILILPLALVFVQSFNNVELATAAGFRGFTLRWYKEVLFGGYYADPFMVSVKIALCSFAIALSAALPAAFALARYPFPGRSLLLGFWLLPLSLPPVALGVGMLALLQIYVGIPAFWGLVAVHVVVILPFAISLLTASVMNLDRSQEEAAASLGADPFRRFLLVTLPGLLPGLFATSIVGFLLSFDEVTVTSFLTTARLTTLPVRLYADASFELRPTAHALSAILILLTVLLLGIVGRFVRLDRLYAR